MPSFTTSMGEANAKGALRWMMDTARHHPLATLGTAALVDFGMKRSYRALEHARGSMEGYITNSNSARIQMAGSGYDNAAMQNAPATAPTITSTPLPAFPLPSAPRGGMMDYRRLSGPGSMVYRDQDLSDLL